ncbi:MAG: hypothetical protein R2814_04470 [Flavobacteriaceae bacterium]
MKNIVLFLGFLFFMACKEKQKADNEVNKSKQDSCFEQVEKINIIKEILKTENIQTYLHQEIKEGNPIRIIKNDFFIGIDSFALETNRYVKIVDSLPKNNLNLRLEILSEDTCRFDLGKYMFYSPIENAEVNGNIKLSDSVWVVTVNQDIEF